MNQNLKWFVLPLANNNEVNQVEPALIKYFGTNPKDKDPIIDPNNYRTLDNSNKMKVRSGVAPRLPGESENDWKRRNKSFQNPSFKQSFTGGLNKKN
jgi:hypothetical protein